MSDIDAYSEIDAHKDGVDIVLAKLRVKLNDTFEERRRATNEHQRADADLRLEALARALGRVVKASPYLL